MKIIYINSQKAYNDSSELDAKSLNTKFNNISWVLHYYWHPAHGLRLHLRNVGKWFLESNNNTSRIRTDTTNIIIKIWMSQMTYYKQYNFKNWLITK